METRVIVDGPRSETKLLAIETRLTYGRGDPWLVETEAMIAAPEAPHAAAALAAWASTGIPVSQG